MKYRKTGKLEGKIVALYGMGDQLGYGEWFLDALGMLHDKLVTKGVKFVGYWPTEGYEFTSPKPVIADGQLFVGLALDETNQYDLSEERIQAWCEQILGEMAEHYSCWPRRNNPLVGLKAARHQAFVSVTPASPVATLTAVNPATRRHPCCLPPATSADASRCRRANAASCQF